MEEALNDMRIQLEKLSLGPGDILVFRLPKQCPVKFFDTIADFVMKEVRPKHPETLSLVIDAGYELNGEKIDVTTMNEMQIKTIVEALMKHPAGRRAIEHAWTGIR